MEVTFGNTFIASDAGNGIVVGILTLAMLISLESAVRNVVFKSKKTNTDMILRMEIFERLSGFRLLRKLLSGLDFVEADLFGKHEQRDGLIARLMGYFPKKVNNDCNDNEETNDVAVNNVATGACELTHRKIHPRRLILPAFCRVLLLIAEIAVIALSGQKLVPDGNGRQNIYLLAPNDGSPISLSRSCTVELPKVRGEQATGILETCTSAVFGGAWAEEKGTATITFTRD